MVQMNIQNLLNAENVADEITVEHADVGSTTSDMADYFFVEKTLGEAIANLPSAKVVLLNSLIDQQEIKAAVNKILAKEGIQYE
jgi:PTS system ascorbate-specific IIB component